MSLRDLFLLITLVICIAGGLFFLTPVFGENARLNDERTELLQQKDARDEKLDSKRTEISKLNSEDPPAIERVLRERFGYCKSGEKIIQLDESTK